MKNRVMLLGRVGGDPEIKQFQDGNQIALLSLATSERWRDQQTGEKKERTEWHQCLVRGKLVQVAQNYVKKGDLLDIEGKVMYRKVTDNSGQQRTFTQILVSQLTMIPTQKANGQGAQPTSSANQYNPQPQPQQQQPSQQAPQGQPQGNGMSQGQPQAQTAEPMNKPPQTAQHSQQLADDVYGGQEEDDLPF